MNVNIQVEHWSIERLVPRANNPRTHSPAQVAIEIEDVEVRVAALEQAAELSKQGR